MSQYIGYVFKSWETWSWPAWCDVVVGWPTWQLRTLDEHGTAMSKK